MIYIEQLKEGDNISQIYLCKEKNTRMTKGGKPYDDVVLQDKSGILAAKIWEVSSGGIEDFSKTDYVEVTGEITKFKDALQLNIRRARKVSEGEYDPADYLPVSDYDVDEMYEELLSFIETIKNDYLRKLLEKIFKESSKHFKDSFKAHSAAKSVHHGFVGGLLEHTLSVTRVCDFIAKNYPYINRDLLISASILHDIGKIDELSLFPENDYTDDGQLLGHIYIGARWIETYARSIEGFPDALRSQLVHCILAHHGELEFGSPKKPAIIEALALSFADNLDAKMETFKESLKNAGEAKSGGWLGFDRYIGSNIKKTDNW